MTIFLLTYKFYVEWERNNFILTLNPLLSPFLKKKKLARVGRANKKLYDEFRAHEKLEIFLKLSYCRRLQQL